MVLHTYVLYPWILSRVKEKADSRPISSELPKLDILIAAYNEEEVIQEKLNSILQADYPIEKIRILVGSDGSTDTTESIVKEMADKHPQLHLFSFERGGKSKVVNELMSRAEAELIILTDANVLFSKDLIKEILSPFSDLEIGLVGADIRARRVSSEVGIEFQENEYLQRETRMKWAEGEKWGTMMGAFGGCYAMRKSLFKVIPKEFLVDDFYLTMKVISQGKKAVLAKDAICFEDISSKMIEEFRRKVRMSRGNFQNLRQFSSFLVHSRPGLSFSFISHKVLRWLTPLALILSFISSFILSKDYSMFEFLFWVQFLILFTPLILKTIEAIGIRSRTITFIAYFISMNTALFVGMIKSFRKVDKAIWEPTMRNQ